MRDRFITQNNLKELLNDAISVSVATAYLSRAAIDDINAVLAQLPHKGGRIFRFLLDKEFNPEPQLRQVLVNMLLELPNTEARIYHGDRQFHAKVYIFEDGNRMCTCIGSFNATRGGAGKHIEAGVQVHDREVQRQAKAFFEQYWDSEDTEIASRDDSAVFVQRKYKAGDCVVIEDSGEKGVILNEEPEFIPDEQEWIYSVHVDQHTLKVRERNLEPVRIANYRTESEFQQLSTDVKEWFKNRTLEKEGDQADNTLASFASSRTELYPYQFRPLFKILHADQPRLLIADEVGLGKTIEAGIILKEFTFRENMKRVLVIVPNSLKTKWQDELQIRFDEYYDILSAKDVAAFLDDYAESPASASIQGVITYDQLTVRSLREKLDKVADSPPIDMVIIDEAHWLKNERTTRHQVVKKLTGNAVALIMMTATPIQIGTKDLYNLLSILVPDLCVYTDHVGFSASLTVNERINRAIQLLKKREFASFRNVVEELTSTRAFRKAIEKLDNYNDIMNQCKSCDDTLSDAEISRLAVDLYGLNVLTHYVNRTLRKNVSEKFPDRDVRTWEYCYTESEAKLYDAIVGACRENYAAEGKSVFAAIMPERRAASSLKAMCESASDWGVSSDEYLESVDILDDGDDPEVSLQRTSKPVALAAKNFAVPITDSKLTELKKIIDMVFGGSKNIADKKLMVFCIFKATVAYLSRQLKAAYPDAHIETLSGDDEIEERDRKRERFRRNDSPALLICTEVAGEGLDFQFCHYLVNYDMPWNPSKLEQRAGRIDRMGQKASIVTIINLVNKHTIEDHIMAKLFERVKLFNNTIGPLGEVISGYQKDFARYVLSQDRSGAAQEAYERDVLKNMENKAREQERFESNEVELFGAVDYFYDSSRKQRSHFLENEIKLIWEKFLGDSMGRVTQQGVVFSITVDEEVRQLLLNTMGEGQVGRFNRRKNRHYRNFITKLAEQSKPLRYTFNQRCALDNLSVQFLNIGHPFIQGAIRSARRTYKLNRDILTCRLHSGKLATGHFLLFLFRFAIAERTDARIQHVEDRAFTLNTEDSAGSWESIETLLNEMIDSSEGKEPDGDIRGIIDALDETLDNEVRKMAEEVLRDYSRLASVARNRKKLSLSRQIGVKIAKIQGDLSHIHDVQAREAREFEIAALKDERETKLAQLGDVDLRISVKCTGIIDLVNEGPD